MATIVDHLVASGFTEASAIRKAELLGVCRKRLGGGAPPFTYYVPGRVEVLGKHTDYAGGRSLTCAIDRGFVLTVRPRSDSHVLAYACDINESVGFDLASNLRPATHRWQNYVVTVARRLAKNFGSPLHGVDMAFASDLPQASGMSSSSALVIATYLALNAANAFEERPEFRANLPALDDLAGYLGSCENGQTFRALAGSAGVGTFGGSEDHTAILLSKAGQLGLYTYGPVRLERRVDWPDEMALVIACSGVKAEKTAEAKEKYNRVSLLMQGAMEVLRGHGWDKPTLAAAIGDDRDAAECALRILSQSRHPTFKAAELQTRFGQFVEEHQRIIPRAVDAIAAHDYARLSPQVDQSQRLAETALLNQVPQTVHLARSARQLGAVAASAFGAGFGGSVWAMVRRDLAEDFATQWRADYAATYPLESQRAVFFHTSPVGGALRV